MSDFERSDCSANHKAIKGPFLSAYKSTFDAAKLATKLSPIGSTDYHSISASKRPAVYATIRATILPAVFAPVGATFAATNCSAQCTA